ncbi:probable inactive receptor kinase At2g26730 [Aristolochia californica]|uniref:probable inactive receptor kinase At2g26730 n=1 Tax=Aristolochia californica TaxID=171875 RepID=UPI0035DA0ED3
MVWPERYSTFHLPWLMNILILTLSFEICCGGKFSETDSLLRFLQTIDPNNVLKISSNGSSSDPCSAQWLGVRCDMGTHTVAEIKLENLNLNGKIDASSLCKLSSIRVLSLANNLILGTIPESLSNCTRLTKLNLSSNLLHGEVPTSLRNLKNLQSLDISKNNLTGPIPNFTQELELLLPNIMRLAEVGSMGNTIRDAAMNITVAPNPVPSALSIDSSARGKKTKEISLFYIYAFVMLAIASFSMLVYISMRKAAKQATEKLNQEKFCDPPAKILIAETKEDNKAEEDTSKLVFYVEERMRFELEDLFESAAELQGQTLLSSLYKVILKDNTILAVKRLKKLMVSVEEFRQAMGQVGKLKHPNLLPLVAYRSSLNEKLLIYRYQRNQSLLHLLESYAEGKREFPWRLRLSIASGIAQGLDYIYRKVKHEIAPHGNLKLSNIILSENEEALISEYGYQRFIQRKRAMLYSSNGYIAPEKKLTEKADVYSYGVILLSLLTGKTVERSGLDLIKWVKAKVREEWTGEVLDTEVNKVGKQWAFPLLNIALKCVEPLPKNRPTIADVSEKIEEIANAQDDYSFSSTSSVESYQQDGSLLHIVIPEGSETPGSIH